MSKIGKGYPAADLIRHYNESNSMEEVVAKTGLTENNINQRRRALALRGVQFKAFASRRGANRLNIEALQQLATSTLPEGAKVFVPKVREVAVEQTAQTSETTETSETAQTA
jgi:hypothetical protein